MFEYTRAELRAVANRPAETPPGTSPLSTGLPRELIASGLSPEAIAARSHVSQSRVRRFIFDGTNISIQNADKLAELLRIEWGYDSIE